MWCFLKSIKAYSEVNFIHQNVINYDNRSLRIPLLILLLFLVHLTIFLLKFIILLFYNLELSQYSRQYV